MHFRYIRLEMITVPSPKILLLGYCLAEVHNIQFIVHSLATNIQHEFQMCGSGVHILEARAQAAILNIKVTTKQFLTYYKAVSIMKVSHL